MGYVTQDDILDAFLTPEETLYYTAKLRLPKLSEEQICRKVYGLLKELKLVHCKDNLVGNSMIRGLSGGEMKRLSIAIELISDP